MIVEPNAGRAKFERYEDWGDVWGDLGEIWGDSGDETQAEMNSSGRYVCGAVLGI